jgi:alkylmercury lyase
MDATAFVQVATQIADGLCGPHERLRVQLLQLLASGHPVSPKTLTEALEWPAAVVAAVVSGCADTEFDDAGRIVGWGLTLKPTTHQFRLGRTTLYTWCALDTLMYPTILAQPADVTSSCPVTGTRVQLRVCPDGIADLQPAAAVVSIALPDQAPCACSRATFCAHGHYFASSDAAETWRGSAPSCLIVPVVAAAELAREIASERLRRAALSPAPESGHR